MTTPRALRDLSSLDDDLVRTGKVMLRTTMQRLRSMTPASARRAQAERVWERLRALDVYAGVKTIASFLPMIRKGEIETVGIDVDARARGLRVAYPCLIDPPEAPRPVMEMRWVDLPAGLDEAATRAALSARLIERGRGFAEPSDEEPIADASAFDLIVVPGLAFDAEGGRVGYGGGYYDGYLARAINARSIAIAYDFQLVADVPRAAHDRRVDRVITPRDP
ncbi:MAG: 5-formyltetrahydrofolate cyclo-ligase [Polyangiales bacterium]